jgi:hypothetical protein
MLFLIALVIAGSIVYLGNEPAGSALIAAGCALAAVRWMARHWFARRW